MDTKQRLGKHGLNSERGHIREFAEISRRGSITEGGRGQKIIVCMQQRKEKNRSERILCGTRVI